MKLFVALAVVALHVAVVAGKRRKCMAIRTNCANDADKPINFADDMDYMTSISDNFQHVLSDTCKIGPNHINNRFKFHPYDFTMNANNITVPVNHRRAIRAFDKCLDDYTVEIEGCVWTAAWKIDRSECNKPYTPPPPPICQLAEDHLGDNIVCGTSGHACPTGTSCIANAYDNKDYCCVDVPTTVSTCSKTLDHLGSEIMCDQPGHACPEGSSCLATDGGSFCCDN